jgi:DNA-binding response OmpR family regulator
LVKVLLIDDDVELAELMREVLAEYSIEVHAVYAPDEGLRALETGNFEMVLLDVMLPQVNGLQVCRKIRYSNATYRNIPIIMLTARTELTDTVVGLETGADDYVRKPFEPRELVARINAVLRRFDQREAAAQRQQGEGQAAEAAAAPGNGAGGMCRLYLDGSELAIDTQRAQVFVNGTKLTITSMEFELIAAMAEQPTEILSRDNLLGKVHGSSVVYTRSIDALIYRLRSKIKEAGADVDFIRTVRGRGYSLVGTPSDTRPGNATAVGHAGSNDRRNSDQSAGGTVAST